MGSAGRNSVPTQPLASESLLDSVADSDFHHEIQQHSAKQEWKKHQQNGEQLRPSECHGRRLSAPQAPSCHRQGRLAVIQSQH